MTGPVAKRLGDRRHLQHGPIDLIISADGARDAAFAAASKRFETILQELVDELPGLRAPLNAFTPRPSGETALRMDYAARPFSDIFITRMAAVAGGVADTVLQAMGALPLTRAYVNNGGDIAVHLTRGTRFTMAMAGINSQPLGKIEIYADDAVAGVATSGRWGRSLSFGIADSVTVLARNAASADVAATLIANAVDLPHHPAIDRLPANQVQPDSDLGGGQLIVTGLGALSDAENKTALNAGARCAAELLSKGQIVGAALFLRGHSQIIGGAGFALAQKERISEHA